MSNYYIGQLLLVPYNFAPRNWAFCAGQILAISQNTALFSLLGTFYGGNGQSTFALPDLQGRIPISQGQGPGLQSYDIGEAAGVESITLLQTEMPMHNHNLTAYAAGTNVGTPVNNVFSHIGISDGAAAFGASTASLDQTLYSNMLTQTGNNLPHENRMPSLVLNWIIALQGVFPPRN